MILKVKSFFIEIYRNKVFKMGWVNFNDLILVIISYVLFGIWIKINFGIGFEKGLEIKMPVEEISQFQEYVDLAFYTKFYNITMSTMLI